MNEIKSVSESIDQKRTSQYDDNNFPLSKLLLSKYDIRQTSRNVDKLVDALRTLGQQDPMAVTKNGDKYIIVNGRTRYLALKKLNKTNAKIKVYENLTQMEQDFLNAQLNVTQNPLTKEEKESFVRKYKSDLNPKELAKALGMGEEMIKNYKSWVEMSSDENGNVIPEVVEAFKSDKEGESKIEEAGKIGRKFASKGIKMTPDMAIAMGRRSKNSKQTRDEKRKMNGPVTDKTTDLVLEKQRREKEQKESLRLAKELEQKHEEKRLEKERLEKERKEKKLQEKAEEELRLKKIEENVLRIAKEQERIQAEKEKQIAKTKKSELDKMSFSELVDQAEKEVTINNNSKSLPINSQEKYKIIDDNLEQRHFDFAIILYTEGIYTKNTDGFEVGTETKRIIDSVNDVTVVGNEILKLTEIEDYGNASNKNMTILNKDVLEVCNKLKVDKRKGLIYVNGASLYSQRPEFMQFLKMKYPNSQIMMVYIDLIFGKSRITGTERSKELITVYAGATTMEEIIAEYQRRIGTQFVQYATHPQEKFIVFNT